MKVDHIETCVCIDHEPTAADSVYYGMPQGVKLGKTMHEINTMAVAVMAKIMESCDYENLKESYESVSN